MGRFSHGLVGTRGGGEVAEWMFSFMSLAVLILPKQSRCVAFERQVRIDMKPLESHTHLWKTTPITGKPRPPMEGHAHHWKATPTQTHPFIKTWMPMISPSVQASPHQIMLETICSVGLLHADNDQHLKPTATNKVQVQRLIPSSMGFKSLFYFFRPWIHFLIIWGEQTAGIEEGTRSHVSTLTDLLLPMWAFFCH